MPPAVPLYPWILPAPLSKRTKAAEAELVALLGDGIGSKAITPRVWPKKPKKPKPEKPTPQQIAERFLEKVRKQ